MDRLNNKPKLTVIKDYDGSFDGAYIKLSDDGKSHHCQESTVNSSLILDFDSGDEMIGIEIIFPIDDKAREEIMRLMCPFCIGEEIVRIMDELPQVN